jgi:hypothetical protein
MHPARSKIPASTSPANTYSKRQSNAYLNGPPAVFPEIQKHRFHGSTQINLR